MAKTHSSDGEVVYGRLITDLGDLRRIAAENAGVSCLSRRFSVSSSLAQITCAQADDRRQWLEAAAGRAVHAAALNPVALVDELELVARTARQVAKHFRDEHEHQGEAP